MTYRVVIGPSSFAELDKTPLEMLVAKGIDVGDNPYKRRLTEEEIIAHLADADGLIAGLEPLNERVLSSAARLKALARVGIGMANVDLAAAERRGIKVSNTPDGPTRAVAELTLAAMLSSLRRMPQASAALHSGTWKKTIGTSLRGARVLLVGYGRIGREVGRLVSMFGAELLICDPAVDEASLEHGERLVELREGLAVADVTTLHAAGETAILGQDEFGAMRPGMVLLNSARGELVDETALVAALDEGIVAAGWFDAFWQEPYTGPLCGYPQLTLTPHMGTYSRQCRLSMETEAVQNLLRDLGIA